jgi:hypothetical protein
MTVQTARAMITAEILKLRRNRALMAFAFLLSVVVIVIVFGYTAIEHSSNPAANSPAGGIDGFHRSLRLLGLFFGGLTSILIGAEAGTADISSGVFRDLVATGRSRLALFAVRTPAAIAVTWAFIAVAYGLAVAGTFLFADGLPTPSASVVLQGLAWLALCTAITTALAVGVGSITGSRAVTLTGVIGWQTVATQLLLNVNSLGSARNALLTPAMGQLIPVGPNIDGLAMATGTAAIVLICWTVIPAALGAWRTRVRDA